MKLAKASRKVQAEATAPQAALVRNRGERNMDAGPVTPRIAVWQTAQRALSELKYALDQHAIVATTDIQGTTTYENGKFCAISEYSQQERNMMSGYDPGVNRYLQKPVDFDQFRNMVKLLGLYWLVTNQAPVSNEVLRATGRGK